MSTEGVDISAYIDRPEPDFQVIKDAVEEGLIPYRRAIMYANILGKIASLQRRVDELEARNAE